MTPTIKRVIEKERLKKEFEQEEIWIMQYEGRRI